MKVLFLNNYDTIGGAAKATYRLYNSISDAGVDVKMLVRFKSTFDNNVIEINSHFRILNKIRGRIENLLLIRYTKRKRNIYSSAILKSFLVKKIKKLDPDIIHIHWIGAAFMDIGSLAQFQKPIVWTLHDSWAFTGGCHVPFECKKYETKCSECPALGSHKKPDLSTLVWKNKKKIYDGLDMTIVSPSNWLADCAKSSSLLSHKKIFVIPNGLDTDTFSKSVFKNTKNKFELDESKRYILFSGNILDKNKGFENFLKSLDYLKDKNNIEILVIGSNFSNQVKEYCGMKIRYLGYIDDINELTTIYSFSKLLVMPSKQESFGQAASEAMSCSIPVVAFSSSGLIDIVDHKINGYLAKPFDIKDFAVGIDWVINNKNYDELCKKAREKVVENFDNTIVARQYIGIYQDLFVRANH